MLLTVRWRVRSDRRLVQSLSADPSLVSPPSRFTPESGNESRSPLSPITKWPIEVESFDAWDFTDVVELSCCGEGAKSIVAEAFFDTVRAFGYGSFAAAS